MDYSNKTIGEYIKQFRKRLGISQHDFENQLDLSTGSLTKIESGKVVPSRESLLKFIKVLDLNVFDTFNILQLPTNKITSLINLINKINLLTSEEEIAQIACNNIPEQIGSFGAAVCLIDGDLLKTIGFTKSWYADLIIQLIPFPYKDFYVSVSKDVDNLMIQSIKTKKLIYSNKLEEFLRPFVYKNIARIFQKTAHMESIISVPMIAEDKVLGVALYATHSRTNFEKEKDLLSAFTQVISTSIYKTRKLRKI